MEYISVVCIGGRKPGASLASESWFTCISRYWAGLLSTSPSENSKETNKLINISATSRKLKIREITVEKPSKRYHFACIRELNQRRQRRQWRRCKKYEFASFYTLSRLFEPAKFDKWCRRFSWSWILKDFIEAQKETGKFVVLCSRPI